jgi:hypothetical protein
MRYKLREQQEESSLNLMKYQKINYKENKKFFNFFKSIYLGVISNKKRNKYEKKVFKNHILKERYITFLKKMKIKKFKQVKKYGKRNKKRI